MADAMRGSHIGESPHHAKQSTSVGVLPDVRTEKLVVERPTLHVRLQLLEDVGVVYKDPLAHASLSGLPPLDYPEKKRGDLPAIVICKANIARREQIQILGTQLAIGGQLEHQGRFREFLLSHGWGHDH